MDSHMLRALQDMSVPEGVARQLASLPNLNQELALAEDRYEVLVRYDARRFVGALAAIVAWQAHPLQEARVLAARALGHLLRLEWDCARHCLRSAAGQELLRSLLHVVTYANLEALDIAAGVDAQPAAPEEEAPAAGSAAEGQAGVWACSACTFHNALRRRVCEMCGTASPLQAPPIPDTPPAPLEPGPAQMERELVEEAVKLLEALARHQSELAASMLPPGAVLAIWRFAAGAAPPIFPADIRRSAAACCAHLSTHATAAQVSAASLATAAAGPLRTLLGSGDASTVEHALRGVYCAVLTARRTVSGLEAAEGSEDEAGPSEEEALGQLAGEEMCSTLIRLLRTATAELSVPVHRETIRLVYVLCAKSPRALEGLLASGLLEALAEALLVARERGEGVGVPRTRVSTAAVAASLAQPGLPPVGMWIAGRDDALPLAMLVAALLRRAPAGPEDAEVAAAHSEAAALSPPPWLMRRPATSSPPVVSNDQPAFVDARVDNFIFISDDDSDDAVLRGGPHLLPRGSAGVHLSSPADPASMPSAPRPPACGQDVWCQAVGCLVPALLTAMRGEEGSAHWHRNAATLVEQLFESADPQCLVSREERASSLSESMTAFALAALAARDRPGFMARALGTLGTALQHLPCSLPLLQRKGVVSQVRRVAAAHASSLERRRSPDLQSPEIAQRTNLLMQRLAGAGDAGRRPEEEAGAAAHRLFHHTLSPMLEAAKEGGEPVGLLHQLKEVAAGLGADDKQQEALRKGKAAQGAAFGHREERAGVGCTSQPAERAVSELADLLRAQRQVSVHDLLDSGLAAALLGYLLGGPARSAAAAVHNLQAVSRALGCEAGQSAPNQAGQRTNVLPTLVSWLQEALTVELDNLPRTPQVSAAGAGARPGAGFGSAEGPMLWDALVHSRLARRGEEGLGVLKRPLALRVELQQASEPQAEPHPSDTSERRVKNISGKTIRVDPLTPAHRLADLIAAQAEFKWFDKPRAELEYVLDARGAGPDGLCSTPNKDAGKKSGASTPNIHTGKKSSPSSSSAGARGGGHQGSGARGGTVRDCGVRLPPLLLPVCGAASTNSGSVKQADQDEGDRVLPIGMGVLHWIGSNGGRCDWVNPAKNGLVKLEARGCEDVEELCGYQFCSSESPPQTRAAGSHTPRASRLAYLVGMGRESLSICLDLGVHLEMTHYRLTTGPQPTSPGPGQEWLLEGSLDGQEWHRLHQKKQATQPNLQDSNGDAVWEVSGPSPCAAAAAKSPVTKGNSKKNKKSNKHKKDNNDGADNTDNQDVHCSPGPSSARALAKGKAPVQADGATVAGEPSPQEQRGVRFVRISASRKAPPRNVRSLEFYGTVVWGCTEDLRRWGVRRERWEDAHAEAMCARARRRRFQDQLQQAEMEEVETRHQERLGQAQSERNRMDQEVHQMLLRMQRAEEEDEEEDEEEQGAAGGVDAALGRRHLSLREMVRNAADAAERVTNVSEEEPLGWRHLIGQLGNRMARHEVEVEEQLRTEMNREGRHFSDDVRPATVRMRRPAIPPWHGEGLRPERSTSRLARPQEPQAAEAAPTPRRFSHRALTAMNPANEDRSVQWVLESGTWVRAGAGGGSSPAEASARVSAPASRVLIEPEDSPEPEARRLEEARSTFRGNQGEAARRVRQRMMEWAPRSPRNLEGEGGEEGLHPDLERFMRLEFEPSAGDAHSMRSAFEEHVHEYDALRRRRARYMEEEVPLMSLSRRHEVITIPAPLMDMEPEEALRRRRAFGVAQPPGELEVLEMSDSDEDDHPPLRPAFLHSAVSGEHSARDRERLDLRRHYRQLQEMNRSARSMLTQETVVAHHHPDVDDNINAFDDAAGQNTAASTSGAAPAAPSGAQVEVSLQAGGSSSRLVTSAPAARATGAPEELRNKSVLQLLCVELAAARADEGWARASPLDAAQLWRHTHRLLYRARGGGGGEGALWIPSSSAAPASAPARATPTEPSIEDDGDVPLGGGRASWMRHALHRVWANLSGERGSPVSRGVDHSARPEVGAEVQVLLNLLLLLNTTARAQRWREAVSDDEHGEGSGGGGARVCVWPSAALGEKLLQALQDPLAVAGGLLPEWCTRLCVGFPELTPLAAREHLFRCAGFGAARSMHAVRQARRQGAERPQPPPGAEEPELSLRKHRVVVSREPALELAARVMQAHVPLHSKQDVLEIGFEGEMGFGPGVTAEWYTLVASKLQCREENEKVLMWQMGDMPWEDEGEGGGKAGLVIQGGGLFPAVLDPDNAAAAHKTLARFRMLGQLVAKALQDARVLPVVLSTAFLKAVAGQRLELEDLRGVHSLGSVPSFITAMEEVAQELAEEADPRARARLADKIPLGCYFVVPTATHVELHPGGLEESVTANNVRRYVRECLHWILHKGLHRQVQSFREGFASVAPDALPLLSMFTPVELQRCIAGDSDVLWDPTCPPGCMHREARIEKEVAMLRRMLVPLHGYDRDSPQVVMLCRALALMGPEDRRRFLTFATGCPHLPPGGLANLQPPITVIRRSENDADLTTASTCFRFVKLPAYTTLEVLEERLQYSIANSAGLIDMS